MTIKELLEKKDMELNKRIVIDEEHTFLLDTDLVGGTLIEMSIDDNKGRREVNTMTFEEAKKFAEEMMDFISFLEKEVK